MTNTRFLAPHPPDGTKLEVDFLDSTFFKAPCQRLPTPAHVRTLSTNVDTSPQPKPVIFRNLDVFVKFGPSVTIAEAQDLMADDGDIIFTHADLHRGNIIISTTAPYRVLAIVDWGQAGWYPDYWEYCKALYTCWHEDEWRRDWIDKFLRPRPLESQVFLGYTMAIGAV